MENLDLNSVNAEQVGAVDQQQTEPVQSTESVNGEVATPQESKPVQSAEENAKYASIRREAEQKAKEEAQKIIDAEYDRLYGEQGIHSKADYDKAVAEYEEQQRIQAESQRMQASPELLKKLEDLEAFKNETLAEREQRQREEGIKAVDKEINDVLEIAKTEGVEITKEQLVKFAVDEGLTDLKKAYKLMKPDVDTKTLKENAVKEYIEAKRQGKIPVESGGSTPVVADESPKDFKSAREGALAMLRASKIFNN